MITRIISDSSCELFDSADGQFRTAPLTISTDERSFLDDDNLNTREMLDYLSRKYILATASNGPYEQQMHRLSLAKMDRYFTYFFISEKIGVSKPSPLFFSKAFEEINANRSEIILSKDTCIIGDSLTSDMKGGLNAGMHTCFINKKGIDNLPKEIDFVLSDLSKISDVL